MRTERSIGWWCSSHCFGPRLTRVRVQLTMRALCGIVLAATLLGGCAQWSSTPYDAQEACAGSGGTYNSSNGTCEAGMEE
jgi:hypothetical protein